jgi:hypothetical protein
MIRCGLVRQLRQRSMTTQLAQMTTCVVTSDDLGSHLGPWWRALTSVTPRLGQFPETGSHTIPALDWQFLDAFRAFSDSQARANGARPDRVSAVSAVREKHNPADIDDISISRIKVVIFYTAPEATQLNRAPIRHAFRELIPSSSPPSPALLAKPYHHMCLHSSQGTHQVSSKYHPSSTTQPQSSKV